MELLDRYLHAIEFWLPKRQRHDIIAELSEDLRSQIEEKEAELGRKLETSELEAILKRCGSPLAVALRYQPQRCLIGPTLFPVYRFVLAVVVTGCVIPRSMIWLGFVIAHPAHRGYMHMDNLWATVIYSVFFTTLAFAIIERSGAKLTILENWNPRKLPAVRDRNRIPIFNSLFEIVGAALLNIWLISVLWPRPVMDFGGAQFIIAPTWKIIFWSLVVLATVNLGLSVQNLFRPYWTRLRGALRVVTDTLGSAIFCWFLKSQVLVGMAAPGMTAAKGEALTNWINVMMANLFWYAVVVSVLMFAINLWKYAARYGAPSGNGRLVQV